jgi:exopolysaccharide biosynthesis protein
LIKQSIFLLSILIISCGEPSNYIPAPTPSLDTTIVKNGKYKVSKHFDGKSKTWYYLTRIYHKDKSGKLLRLRLALTDPSQPMGETASEFASRTNALLVFNASMSTIVSESSGKKKRIPSNIQIIDGNIVQKKSHLAPWRYTLGIKDNNELVVYPPDITAQEILDDDTNTALTAFVPLIKDYKPVSDNVLDNYGLKNLSVKNPRQVIAQYDNLDIVFLTCGGRGYGGEGMTAKDIIRIMKELGVKFAFNLDGGGSISTVVDGKFINWKIDNHGTEERPRANFLYIKR